MASAPPVNVGLQPKGSSSRGCATTEVTQTTTSRYRVDSNVTARNSCIIRAPTFSATTLRVGCSRVRDALWRHRPDWSWGLATCRHHRDMPSAIPCPIHSERLLAPVPEPSRTADQDANRSLPNVTLLKPSSASPCSLLIGGLAHSGEHKIPPASERLRNSCFPAPHRAVKYLGSTSPRHS